MEDNVKAILGGLGVALIIMGGIGYNVYSMVDATVGIDNLEENEKCYELLENQYLKSSHNNTIDWTQFENDFDLLSCEEFGWDKIKSKLHIEKRLEVNSHER